MTLSIQQATRKVLAQAGKPLHYKEITQRILAAGLTRSNSRTPAASVRSVLSFDLKRKGNRSAFVRVGPGVFDLRKRHAAGPLTEGESEGTDRRVHIPLFPRYDEVRALLPIWDSRPRAEVTALQATFAQLRGTPQEPVDWTSPDEWIPERLSGTDRDLALAIWQGTKRIVNPRHVYGHWLLVRRYRLLTEDEEGVLHVSERGAEFRRSPGGEVEAEIDEAEGLFKVLAIVADHGPAPFREFVPEWGDYLSRRSRFGTESTVRETLRRRLANLLARELVERTGTGYGITKDGLAHLARGGDEDSTAGDSHQEIRTLLEQQRAAVRESLSEILSELDPYAFEHLIQRLLEELGYDDVSVTGRSGDGGVDVVANIELGITSVREVVQVKRHRRAIQRKDLDALRGSLHRFGAVRGTLITTSRFSRGTRQAAFERGAAPITLIDGDKLIDLLIEHGIGVRKSSIDLLELDADVFADLEESLRNQDDACESA